MIKLLINSNFLKTELDFEKLFKEEEKLKKCNNYIEIKKSKDALNKRCKNIKETYKNMMIEGKEESDHFDSLKKELKKEENKKCSDYEEWRKDFCAQHNKYGIRGDKMLCPEQKKLL